MREFGTKQRAWVKVLRADELDGDESLAGLGPEAWPDPPPLRELLDAPRPLHTLLRDQQVITGIGRTWVDEILNVAKLSPFKRGDDLDDDEADALRAATVSELGRVIDAYEAAVELPLPEKYPKPTRIHAHQGEPCPQCGTVARGRLLRGLRHDLLPARPDRGPGPQGPPALAPAQVGGGL